MAGDKTTEKAQAGRNQGPENKGQKSGAAPDQDSKPTTSTTGDQAQNPEKSSVAEQLVDSGTQDIQGSVAAIGQEVEAALKALEVAKVEFEEAKNATTKANEQITTAKEKYDAAKEKAEPIQEEIDAAKEKQEAAEEALETAEENAEESNIELTEGERKTFQDKIDAAKAKVEAAEAKMKPVDEEFDAAKDDLKAAQTELGEAQSSLAATTTNLSEAQTRVIAVQEKAIAAGSAVADTARSIADGSIINELEASTALGDVDINMKGTRFEAEYAPDESRWSLAGSINAVTDVKPELLGRYTFGEDSRLFGMRNFVIDGGLISGETGVTRPNDLDGRLDFAPVRIGEFGHRDTYDGLGIRATADYGQGDVSGTASTFFLTDGTGGLDTSLAWNINDDTLFTGGAGAYLGDESRLYLSGQIDQNTDWGSYYGRLQHTTFTGESPIGEDSLTTGSAGARFNLGEDGQGILLGERGYLTDKFADPAWGVQYFDLRASMDSLNNSNIYGGVGLGKVGGMNIDVGAQYDIGNEEVTPMISGSLRF